MSRVVNDFFAPMEAAAQGLSDTPTTLATIILCESVLQYLSMGDRMNTQYSMLRVYGVTRSDMTLNGRLVFYSTQVGVDPDNRLQVNGPALRRVWLTWDTLPRRASSVARDVPSFFSRPLRQDKARTGRACLKDDRGAPHLLIYVPHTSSAGGQTSGPYNPTAA